MRLPRPKLQHKILQARGHNPNAHEWDLPSFKSEFLKVADITKVYKNILL